MKKLLFPLAVFATFAHAALPGMAEVPCEEYNLVASRPIKCSFAPVVKIEERRWEAMKKGKAERACIDAVVAAEGVPPWMVKNVDGSQHCKK
jgi:hypothetical protein